MGLKSLLTTLALSAFALGMNAQTLTFGIYNEVEEYTDFEEDYDFTCNNVCDRGPININYHESGSQTILYSDEIKDLAHNNISSIGLKFYYLEDYGEHSTKIKIYISETSANKYEKINKNNKFFDISNAKKVYEGTVILDSDSYSYYYTFGPERIIKFDTPYYYNGDNNLVITFMASTEDITEQGAQVSTYCVSDMVDRTLTCCTDYKGNSFTTMLEGNRDSGTNHYSCGLVEAPMMAIGYESATAPDATYKTFVTSCDVDFTAIKGVEAYKVASVGSSSIKLEAIESAKAGTPVILKTNIQPSFTTGTATAVSDNMLQASDGTVTSDGTFYCLATKNGVQAFYPVTSGVKIPKGKAYVQIAGGAAKMNIALDDVTAISTATTTQKSDAVYNLQGQRTEAAKGIFIVGGKKVIKK